MRQLGYGNIAKVKESNIHRRSTKQIGVLGVCHEVVSICCSRRPFHRSKSIRVALAFGQLKFRCTWIESRQSTTAIQTHGIQWQHLLLKLPPWIWDLLVRCKQTKPCHSRLTGSCFASRPIFQKPKEPPVWSHLLVVKAETAWQMLHLRSLGINQDTFLNSKMLHSYPWIFLGSHVPHSWECFCCSLSSLPMVFCGRVLAFICLTCFPVVFLCRHLALSKSLRGSFLILMNYSQSSFMRSRKDRVCFCNWYMIYHSIFSCLTWDATQVALHVVGLLLVILAAGHRQESMHSNQFFGI